MTDWPLSEPDEFGCRLWESKLDKDGYGVSWKGGRPRRAHVAVWEEANGPVPDGTVLDHVCRVRACCRLVHLEAVTQSENERRKSWRYRAKQERCAQGHDMRVNAVVLPSGGRVCRTCNREGG